MRGQLRLVVFLGLALLATVVYVNRIHREKIDFVTWRQAAVRALGGESLYRH